MQPIINQLRPAITTTEQLEWQSSLVCRWTEHLIPYNMLATLCIAFLVLLCGAIGFGLYDLHARAKHYKRIQTVARGMATRGGHV